MNTNKNRNKATVSHEKTLEEAIRSGDTRTAKAILRKTVHAKQDASASELAYLYADCVGRMLSGTASAGEGKPERLLFPDAASVCLYLELLVDELCSSEEGNESDGSTESEIFSYVDRNIFLPELSLSMVAERFERQKSFVSALYKREKGINYVDYVNRIRIKRAAELLQKPEEAMSLEVICNAVGYISQSTFRRNFVKYMGCMPGHFRKASQSGK